MAEIRIPRRGPASRRDAEPEQAADPLAEMAAQIHALDSAAEQAAVRIGEAASKLDNRERRGGSATRADLLAGLASALVDRTGEIRADCKKLAALMERTAKLVAERDDAAAEAPPPAAETVTAGSEADPIATATQPTDEPEPELADGPEPTTWIAPDFEPAEPPAAESRPERGSTDPSLKPDWLTGAGDEPGPPVRSTSEGVRLIATQMAIGGSTRGEIERRLRIQFGVRDAARALDEIFGTRRSGVG